ncbi:AsmA family protein [Stutzerimonas kirkiae]|uniref:AsmA family protein n=1 Tax=Stutzerimonas kirkiae TaxID=2211392 RepID=A0A4V2KDE5_9GAMM|nr:AsmA family protein [Stutzerimonas kirkiae]TBU98845.1 AsmA family protein [Stutzerimonas kirkiae]TBV03939.1 AsmA family protein [Stutzerimonas kirkiae]TBV16817.1 AsmA family protein [Stutzerimonas kirkiae]
MRYIRKLMLWLVAVFLLLVVALVLFLALFDWNRARPFINQQVSAALDRPFAIEGDLRVAWQREAGQQGLAAWIPWPNVSAERLRLGNPEWAQGETFVSLDSVRLRLALLPLLRKTVRIPSIELGAPLADLQRLADGRANWTFELGGEPSDEPGPWTLDIGTIGFDKGQLTLDDQSSDTRLEASIAPLGEPIPFAEIVGKNVAGRLAETNTNAQDYAFAWQAKGHFRGQAVTGSGRVGGLLALHDASQPFPLQADLRIGATHIVLAGSLTDPQNLGALDLRLRLSGSSLDHLYPLTGVTLPQSPRYSTDGRLQADLRDADGAVFRYLGFTGRIGDSDIHGDLTFVAREPRPKLSGQLTSNQLLFSDLAPLIGADSSADTGPGEAGRDRQPANKVLPASEFRTDRWRAMDADVRFIGKRIVHSEHLPITDLDTHVLLHDGMLGLEPLRFGLAGGQLDAQIHLNGAVTPLQGQMRLSARDLKLKQLFPGFAPMQTSFGELNGDASLAARGNSLAALLGAADGELKMLINDGAVSRGLMEIAGLNVGNYLVGRLFGDDEVKIHCAAADLGIERGLMSTRLFVVDTDNAVVKVDGSANFASERLDFTITPATKGLRIFSLRSPLYVRGTFKAPDAGVEATPLALRGAGLLALGVAVAPAAGLLALVAPSAGDEPSQCEPLLRQIQGGD